MYLAAGDIDASDRFDSEERSGDVLENGDLEDGFEIPEGPEAATVLEGEDEDERFIDDDSYDEEDDDDPRKYLGQAEFLREEGMKVMRLQSLEYECSNDDSDGRNIHSSTEIDMTTATMTTTTTPTNNCGTNGKDHAVCGYLSAQALGMCVWAFQVQSVQAHYT